MLAIAFAGGIIGIHQPAFSQTDFDWQNSVIQLIASSDRVPSDVRAYYLLSLASNYLTREDSERTRAKFDAIVERLTHRWLAKDWENNLVASAESATLEARIANGNQKSKTAKPNSLSLPVEESNLANKAIREALAQLNVVPNDFARLNLYFIASLLYQRLGNVKELEKCNKILNEALDEVKPHSDEELKAASSVLNSMAYGLVPLRISDNPDKSTKALEYPDSDFRASEKLKLRAVAFADRLPADDHVRRKAHRDLSLWYKRLGKAEQADREKEILFELVGTRDDEIFYPQSRGCGQIGWWLTKNETSERTCGMG